MAFTPGDAVTGVGGLTPEQAATLLYFQYNESTDKLEATKSIETILASIYLGINKIKVSGGGENVIFTDLPTGINWSPPWQGVKDQSVPANQDSTGLIPIAYREYSENLLSVEQGGIISPTNVTDYSSDSTFTENISAFGVRFRLGQTLDVGNILKYSLYIGNDASGVRIYQFDKLIESTYSSGDFFDLWFDHQSEIFANATIFAEIQVETELNSGVFSVLQVYATDADPNAHYALVKLRTFENINTEDAPTDGKQYGRQSSGWTEIIHEGHYLGVFADLAALQTAHPTANDGDTATVTSPTANLFFWNGSSWQDSGTGYIGDMLKAIYDPTGVSGNAFDMGKMVEAATAKILTQIERDHIATNNDKVSFPEAPEDGEQYARKDAGWEIVGVGADKFKLSVDYVKNGVFSAGSYMVLGEISTTITHGWIAPQDLTLEAVTIARTDVDNADIEIVCNGSVVATVNSSGLTTVDTSMSVACLQGHVIVARNKTGSNTMSNVICSLIFGGTI